MPWPVLLEDGILVTEVTVGLQPLSTNTSLWPGLQLDGRSGRPGLINRLVAPLLWGCFTGVNQGCLAPEYILSIALVSLRWISGEKIDIPLLDSVAGGEWMKRNENEHNYGPQNQKKTCGQDFIWFGLGLWNKNKDNELASFSFGGVRRWITSSHQAIAIAIDKGFQALISGRLRSIKRLRNGTFLVECDTKKQSDLLKSQKLVDRPMKVGIHPTLNSSRGVIRCRELASMSETDIRDELSEQGVILVKRIRRNEDGQDKDTNTLFLTFCNANLPKDIRIGYLRVKVDPFVPNPLRCFKCQKYGHGAQRCSSTGVCPKCALEHEGPCTNPPKCVNCKGAHPSSSKDCDVWKKEKQIQQVKTERKISYPDARRIVQETNSWLLPGAKPLFASVAAKQMVSCAV